MFDGYHQLSHVTRVFSMLPIMIYIQLRMAWNLFHLVSWFFLQVLQLGLCASIFDRCALEDFKARLHFLGSSLSLTHNKLFNY